MEIESENTGKPFALTLSDEIGPMLDQIRFFAGAARVLEGKATGEYMRGFTSSIRREPRGPIGQVAPWNYPMMMSVWKFAPALAAGNTVVLKPSDTTPASAAWMVKKMQEIFPQGVANLVCGDRDTGAALAPSQDPGDGVDHRLDRAGIAVATAAAADIKVAHLELGGNAPVVVFNDADFVGGRGDPGSRPLQRRPGLHRGDARHLPGRGLRRVRRRTRQGGSAGPGPVTTATTRTSSTARSTTRTSCGTCPAWWSDPGARQAGDRWAPGG